MAVSDAVESIIEVQRFDPATDAKPYFQSFAVTMVDKSTLLDVLLYIAETLEPRLAFRRVCRSGICGACAGLVNGTPSLFCQVSLDRAAARAPSRIVQIAPLPGFAVLQDLVVDMDGFLADFDRVEGWLDPDPAYDGVLLPSQAEALWPAAACVLCGICSAGSEEGGLHAAAVARVLRLAHDPRDARGRDRLRTLGSVQVNLANDLLNRVCPKGVDVTGLLE